MSLGVRPGGLAWFVFAEKADKYHQVTTRTLVQTNTWYHFAGILGPGGMKFYLNGWLMGTDPYPAGFDKTLSKCLFRLGEGVTERDPPSAVRGTLDEFRIWNRALSQEEIREGMHQRLRGREPNLVALWNFDDGTARDSGTNGWHGALMGRAAIEPAEIPVAVGAKQSFLDARVHASDGTGAKSVVLEVLEGTNVLAAAFSEDGIFKLIIPAAERLKLRASQLAGHTDWQELQIPPGEQRLVQVDLPRPAHTRENTNQFAAAINHLLAISPESLEKLDTAVLLTLRPLLLDSEAKILTLFDSPDVGKRRFIATFVEKFERSSVPVIVALARARHDQDQLVRGLAQSSLQTLPVPKEFESVYTKRKLTIASLFAGLLIPFALIHFFLFVLNPTTWSNLYYGLFAAAGALMIYYGAAADSGPAATQISTLAFMTLGLLVLNSLFYSRFPWTFWVVVTIALLATAALFIQRQELAGLSALDLGDSSAKPFPGLALAIGAAGYVAFAIVVLEMLRVVLRSVWRRQEGAWLIGIGFLMLVLGGILRIALYGALFTGGISTDSFATYIIYFPSVGAAGFVLCGSIYLARAFSQSFAEVRTAKAEIEKKNTELTVARDVALSANRAKSQFLANMSHELRTPLNAIIGYSELIAEVVQEEGHKQYLADLQKITTAAKHQLMLVNDILDLSKIEAGKMVLKIEEFGVKELIQDIRSLTNPLVAKHRNRFELAASTDLGTMRADSMKIRQILFNLLSNAAKFTEDGLITLRVAPSSINGASAIAFAVEDTGIGMTQEQASRLFQAFTQAEAGIHQKYGGTGLGLVISKRFCEMMGGTLTVRSEFGKGSTFLATIPQNVTVPPEVSKALAPSQELSNAGVKPG